MALLKASVVAEFVQDWNSLKEKAPRIVVTREEGVSFKLVTNRIKEDRALLLESMNTIYDPYSVPIREVMETWKFQSYFTDTLPEPGSTLEQLTQSVREIKADLKELMEDRHFSTGKKD